MASLGSRACFAQLENIGQYSYCSGFVEATEDSDVVIAVPALASPERGPIRIDEEEWLAQVSFVRVTAASLCSAPRWHMTCLSFSSDVMFTQILIAYQAAGCSSGTVLQTARSR